jgi:hypothetical protein
MQLQTIKKRARYRAAEQGAIMFIVSMTLALLATVGAFAVMQATTEARTSGYVRRATQAQALSEYAVLVTQTALSDPGVLQNIMTHPNPQTSCESLAAVPLSAGPNSKACYFMPYFAPSVPVVSSTNWPHTLTGASNQLLQPKTGPAAPGSLGLADTTGDFQAELTDRACGDGLEGVGGGKILRFAIRGTGRLRPSVAANDTQRFASTSISRTHGWVQVPVTVCPQ